MIKSIALALLLISFTFACNSSKDLEHSHSDEAHKHSDVVVNEAHSLKLNDGNKWRINKEMKPFLEKSNNILNKYIKSDDTDYQALASSLDENNNKLISSCTMTGSPHNALHLWLEPHIELIEDLKNSRDVSSAREIVQKLKQSFDKFDMFFE